MSKHDLISPMARKDIFLGGSVYDLAAEYKSHHSLDVKSHIVSLTHVPDHSKVLMYLLCIYFLFTLYLLCIFFVFLLYLLCI